MNRVCVKGNYINEVTNLFAAINTFIKDKKLEKLLIEYCKEKGIINDWEYEFSLSTHFKKQLSDKQLEKREAINTKILSKLSITSILETSTTNISSPLPLPIKKVVPPPILKKK